jgi:hypothetical protein
MLIVAIEDRLSEAVATKVAKHVLGEEVFLKSIVGNGFGSLRRKLPNFRNASRQYPVWLLTDLDRWPCPVALINEWTGGAALPANFSLRVAVREIESWLLADRSELAEFLGVSNAKIARNPDSINDPKRYLVNLARAGRRAIREDIVPRKGSAASQGFGYNVRLCEFVEQAWSPDRASGESRSLEKAMMRLSKLKNIN